MRRTLLALMMLIGFGAAVQVARADVSVDFFYNNLSGGSWIEVGDYGYCWQPDAAVNNADWRPYADGYWAYTDEGWTWVSYEDFGWATYHYGRWAHLADLGWVWVPGRDEDLEWGPAWVSWRTGDQYVGWAPLPPAGEPIYEGRPITGYVDIEFDIGPAYYNFIDVRYIGEPVLRERIFAPGQNIIYINQTINVTNIIYKNKVVYNYGPDINVINRRSSRPIQRLTIQREANADFTNLGKSGGLKTKVQGQSLVVAAPAHIGRSTRQIAPPTVKTKIAKPNLDTGWAGVGDAKAKEQYKQKLRSEQANKISGGSSTGVNVGAQAGTSPVTTSPEVSPVAGANTGFGKGGKHNPNWPGQTVPPNTGAAGASPAGGGTPVDASGRGEGGKDRSRQGGELQNPARGRTGAGPTVPPTSPESPTGTDASGYGPRKIRRLGQQGATSPSGMSTPVLQGQGGGAVKNHVQGQGGSGQSGGAAGQGQSVQQDQGQGQGQGQHMGTGRKNKGDASPAPSPQ